MSTLREQLGEALKRARALQLRNDTPRKPFDRRGFNEVKAVCGRLELPLPTQRLADRSARSWADLLVHQLALVVRASAMGNRQDLKSAVLDVAATAAAWGEQIESRGP